MASQPMIEIPSDCPVVRAVTLQTKKAVYYAVEYYLDEEKGWVSIWDKTIRFGRDKLHRPAGYAFVQTAQEQERQLADAKKVVSVYGKI
jgi:hypothetical protein